MENKITYLILNKENNTIDKRLEDFNSAGNYNCLGVVSNFDDVFIKNEKCRIDALFVYDNFMNQEILQDSLVLVKRSLPYMCICLFTNAERSFTHVDYQYNLTDANMKIYNVLHRVKNVYGTKEDVGFFVPPQKITELFNVIEIKKKYKGYDYLKDAIAIACRNKQEYLGNMSKLYERIASQYNVKKSSIERCIRLLINESTLDFDCNKITDTKYSSLINAIQTSTNASFIRSIVTFLSENMYA